MSTTALPLDALAHRIARRQAELESLRREFESRQMHLGELRRLKAGLKAQLQQIEAEILAVARAQAPATPAPSGPDPSPGAVPPTRRKRLADVLVSIIREAGRPVRIKQLAEEITRRRYAPRTTNLPALIKAQVSELVERGVLSRPRDRAQGAAAQ